MNYRHAFHAGNHADILKHAVLLACLAAIAKKPAPFCVLDAFAGAGAYDLHSIEAARSPEWRDGVGRLVEWREAPTLVAPLIDAAHNAAYPGSPTLILERLRADDRLIACDLHPDECTKLRARIGGDARAHVHQRDGFAALTALLPFAEKRGLILLDPPYERPDELARSVEALKGAVQRFRQGVYLWWRPEKPGLDLAGADRAVITHAKLEWLRARLAVDDPRATTKLVASSMLVLNPPFGLRAALEDALPAIGARLARGPGAAIEIDAG